MSIECGICERDLRGGHADSCPRHPNNSSATGPSKGTVVINVHRCRRQVMRIPLRELVALKRDLDQHTARSKAPPCMECGAMTEDEAGRKCICAGDKDDCHGCRLWPDA